MSARKGGEASIEALLNDVDRLHTPPEIALSLLRLTRDNDFSVQQVAECLARDPGMSAKILRVVNSSRYGLRLRVSSLDQAIVLLGSRTVRLIALSFAIVDTLTKGRRRDWYVGYWRRALTTALAADRLCRRTKASECQDAYTAGLLADIGVLALASARPEQYQIVADRNLSGNELIAAERDAFGFDHAVASARLLERWSFSPAIVAAVKSHHELDPGTETIDRVLRTASLLADFLWSPGSASKHVVRRLVDEFAFSIDEVSDLMLELREELRVEAELFGFHLPANSDPERLLAEARQQCFDAMLDTAVTLDSLEAVIDGPATLE